MDLVIAIMLLIFLRMLGGTIINTVLVARLRKFHVNSYKELEQPDALFFIGINWLFKSKYMNWLWSPKHNMLKDSQLSTLICWFRLIWITSYAGIVICGLLIILNK